MENRPDLRARLVAHKAELVQCVESESEATSDASRSWPHKDQELIYWFHTRGREVLPSDPFELHGGVRIVDPGLFADRLHQDIGTGPGGPRARTGALISDLRLLRELVDKPAPSTDASVEPLSPTRTPDSIDPEGHGEPFK